MIAAVNSINRLRHGDPVPLHDYMRDLKSAYELGGNNRFLRNRRVPADGAPADYHLGTDSQLLKRIEVARDIVATDVIVGSGIRTLTANVMHGGYHCDHETGNADLDMMLKEDWEQFISKDQCDVEQKHNLHQLAAMAFEEVVVGGDMVVSLTDEDNLQTFESHRLRSAIRRPATTTQTIYGVEVDEKRRRVRYWVTPSDDFTGRPYKKNLIGLSARDEGGNEVVLHLYRGRRKSATRGVTALIPIANTASQHDDVHFAKLVQQQIVSCFAILRERQFPPPHEAGKGKGRSQQGPQTLEEIASADGFRRLFEHIYPGMEVRGEIGERLSGFSPNVPNVEYFDHVRLMLTFIAVNLDLPLILLLMDASETNFSGWRGAMDQAKLRLCRWQEFMRDEFYAPIRAWRIRRKLAMDEAARTLAMQAGVNAFRFNFQLPTWPYIEPLKDNAADLLQTRNALNSHRRIQAGRGRDWDRIAVELPEDNAQIIRNCMRLAQAIRKEYPTERIDWRELLSLPTPDNVSAVFKLGEDNGSATSANNN